MSPGAAIRVGLDAAKVATPRAFARTWRRIDETTWERDDGLGVFLATVFRPARWIAVTGRGSYLRFRNESLPRRFGTARAAMCALDGAIP